MVFYAGEFCSVIFKTWEHSCRSFFFSPSGILNFSSGFFFFFSKVSLNSGMFYAGEAVSLLEIPLQNGMLSG